MPQYLTMREAIAYHNDFLLQHHAGLEVLWTPVRHAFKEKRAALIFAARREGYLRPPVNASDQRGWKRGQRSRDQLTSRGLWAAGRITAEGRRWVRARCWMTTAEHLREAVRRIEKCVAQRRCRQAGWVPETFVAGHKWGASSLPLADAQIVLLPALIDQWIKSQSTVRGHVFYRLADGVDGEAAIAETMPEEIQFDGPCCSRHEQHRLHLKTLLLSGRLNISTLGELGGIPLPVGVPMLDESRTYDDIPFGLLVEGATDGP
jgi:hypothetical protein